MAMRTLTRTAGYARLAGAAYRARRAAAPSANDRARRHLAQQMGKLRGLPQKVGQMLSFGAGGNDDVNEYAMLQEDAEPLSLDDVLPVLEQAWGRPVSDVLAEIEPEARAGSLGQVHRAVLLDGREVAIKVQYPGIRQAVMTDLKAVGWLSLPVGNLRRGFDLADYQQAILANLECELDYQQEAANQREFHAMAEASQGVVVPQVVDELCQTNVFVSYWEEGDHWQIVCRDWTDAEKQDLATCLLHHFLQALFFHGKTQADWHPGNVRFRRNSSGVQVVLYDLGCLYEPSEEERAILSRLIRATINGTESPWPLMLKLGFKRELLEPLQDKLPAICRILFEPFAVSHPYDLANWNLNERLADVLGDDRMNFRLAGPAGLIYFIRSFHGITHYLRGLGATINWRRPFEASTQWLGPQMQQLSLPPCESAGDFRVLAQQLKIRVIDQGQTKVQLSLPATAIENLDTLVDADIKQRLQLRHISISQVVSDVRRRGYAPGPVFELHEANRSIKITLE